MPQTTNKLRAIGVATTTPIAFYWDGKLHFERMSLLSSTGAGVLSAVAPPVGEKIQVGFRLSTSSESICVNGEIVGGFPTTPEGMELRASMGASHFDQVAPKVSDSATAIFKLSDLAEATATSETSETAGARLGFAIRFMDLTGDELTAIERHITTSRRLGDRKVVRNGRVVSVTDLDDRRTIAALFDEGDIRKKTMDW